MWQLEYLKYLTKLQAIMWGHLMGHTNWMCILSCILEVCTDKNSYFPVWRVSSLSFTGSLYINRGDTNTWQHIRDTWTTIVFLFSQKLQEYSDKMENKTNWNSEFLTVKLMTQSSRDAFVFKILVLYNTRTHENWVLIRP